MNQAHNPNIRKVDFLEWSPDVKIFCVLITYKALCIKPLYLRSLTNIKLFHCGFDQ